MRTLRNYTIEQLAFLRSKLERLFQLERLLYKQLDDRDCHLLYSDSCACGICKNTYKDYADGLLPQISLIELKIKLIKNLLSKKFPDTIQRLDKLSRLIVTDIPNGQRVGIISSALAFGTLEILGQSNQRIILNQSKNLKPVGSFESRISTLKAREKRLLEYRFRLLHVPRDDWGLSKMS